MNKSINEINCFKKKIEENTNHNFLSATLEKPVIDEDKLFFLLKLVPQNSALPPLHRDVYIITTMLVQIALDTHELVTENSEDESNGEKLENQLRVLAGDYYSGLYYYLLAEIDDLKFIHKLATAIKAINELKMKVFYREYESFDEYIDLKVQIESLLFEAVANYFEQENFVDSFKQWQYITFLTMEKDRITADEILLDSILEPLMTKTYMVNEDKFEYLINNEWMNFEGKIKQLPHSTSDIHSYFNRKRIKKVYRNTLHVEEG